MPDKVKTKSPFAIVQMVFAGRPQSEFDALSAKERASFSAFLVNRILSMYPDLTDIVSQLDPFTTGLQMDPRTTYALYSSLLGGQRRKFAKYIKGKSDKVNKEEIQALMFKYEISESEAFEAHDLLSYVKPEEITRIKKLYYP